MTANTIPPAGTDQELDLGELWRGIRRRAPGILLATLALGAGTYVISKNKPPVYSASASVISSNTASTGNDSLLTGAIYKASPLPEGAIPQAVQSTQVIRPLMQSIRQSKDIPAAEKARIVENLQRELRAQDLQTINISSRVEQYSGGNGIYTLTAKARTPEAAAAVANLTSKALLDWDQERALQSIRRAEAGFKAQLSQIDAQLDDQTNAVERETLVARRANVTSSLATVSVLRDSITGVLTPLSEAVAPLQPDSPRPLRDAILASLLGLLLSTAGAALFTIFDRTVRREDDLLALDLPVLASIPRIKPRAVAVAGIVRAARQAGLYEAIGFLRVNLLSKLQDYPRPIIMVTSTAPGEGKSSVAATLADGFASSGMRVLIIDTDLRRGTQEAVWKKFNESGQWRVAGPNGARSVREALMRPHDIQPLRVADNIDLLPRGEAIHDSLTKFDQADIGEAFRIWQQRYDVILVDSAPLLALADGLIIGKYVDGIILVTEYGHTPLQGVRNALRRARSSELNILGAVINKADSQENESYSYSYTYGMQQSKKS